MKPNRNYFKFSWPVTELVSNTQNLLYMLGQKC